MHDKTILIIDDDQKLRSLLAEYLQGYGFAVETLPDGKKAVDTVLQIQPDAVILDVMMPGPDGFDVLRELRSNVQTPVIMLTAKGDDIDLIMGLELGADDYLAKPFNPRALLARIRAVLRRSEQGAVPEEKAAANLESDGLALDLVRQELVVDDDTYELSCNEFKLMHALMKQPGVAISRDDLMTQAFGKEYSAFDRSVDVYICRLRGVLKKYSAHDGRIKTVWGTGYMLVESKR